MLFLNIFVLLIFSFFNFINSSTCPTKEFFSNGECHKCISNCEECNGPEAYNCQACLPTFCPSNRGCEKCGEVPPTILPNFIPTKRINNFEGGEKFAEFTIYFIILCFALVLFFIFCCCSLFFCYCIIMKVDTFRPLHRIFNLNERRKERLFDEEMPDVIYRKGFPSTQKPLEGNLLIKQKEKIGKGTFGDVFKCPYVEDGVYIYVAIKIAKLGNKEAAREREILSQLSHLHIVDLLAFNLKENLILIMPLRRDNLKEFMVKEKSRITNEHQIRYCMQIADAFRYIAHKKFVHGDLKASNILVDNIKHIEVCDFGKCVNMGNKKKVTGTITHTALELLDKMNPASGYSCEKTDVWSFGVTVWEIFNLCQKNPYDDEIKGGSNGKKRNITEISILDYLTKGQRLNTPPEMQPALQSIMIDCWLLEAHQRPNFNTLFEEFSRALPECEGLPQYNKKITQDNTFFKNLL